MKPIFPISAYTYWQAFDGVPLIGFNELAETVVETSVADRLAFIERLGIAGVVLRVITVSVWLCLRSFSRTGQWSRKY